MEESHRKLLQKYRMAIAKDLDPQRILGYLARLDTFTEDDEEEVKSMESRSARVEKLLDILPRKEPGTFECFVRSLQKECPHLAKPLIKESGLALLPSQDDQEIGMSPQHKKILRQSRPHLQAIKMETLLPNLNILNTHDKELIASRTTTSEKVEELVSILIRKGPDAFEGFVSVLKQSYPKEAKLLMTSSISDQHLPSPVQETSSAVTGSTLVQNLLQTTQLDSFKKCMDKEDDFGSDWRTLYKELDLPEDKISVFEEKKGSPTENVLSSWCKRKGSEADVLTLLQAVSRCQRGDCLLQLEKDLQCRLSRMEDLNNRMGAMGFEQADGRRRVLEHMKDLSERELSLISAELSKESTKPVRQKLREKCHLENVSELPMTEVLRQCGTLRIRDFTELLKDLGREGVIGAMKAKLPSGTTGPTQREAMYVRDMSYVIRSNIAQALSGDDSWRRLGEELRMANEKLQFLQARYPNPADEVLRFWEVKAGSRIGNLYDILVRLGYPQYADKL